MLEDIGTYLVAHSKTEALRRLLRFGGNTFIEFLHSLEDLQSRIHLAVPALEFPALEVEDVNNQNFLISVIGPNPEFAPVLAGVLRALADDYGALVLIEPGNRVDGGMQLMISVTEAQFTVGRQFELAGAQV